MAKTRIDAWWSALKPQQQEEVYRKSFSSPHGVVRAWIAQEFGVRQPSKTAYYNFLEAYAEEWSASSPVRAGVAVKLVQRLAEKAKVDDESFVASLKALAAEAQMTGGDTAAADKLLRLAVALRRSALDAEKLRLDRDRFDAAERREAAARGALSDGKLTPQERESRLREIFGI